jgi:hypothetical protein
MSSEKKRLQKELREQNLYLRNLSSGFAKGEVGLEDYMNLLDIGIKTRNKIINEIRKL